MNPIAIDNQSAIIRDMKFFREIIKARMEALDWTAYRLATECHAKGLHKVSVYRYLRGERDMNADNLMIMLETLGLSISAKPKKPRRSGNAKA